VVLWLIYTGGPVGIVAEIAKGMVKWWHSKCKKWGNRGVVKYKVW